jgi:hypothetical protein
MQNKKSWLVGLSAVAILAFAPLVAHATPPPEDNVYVNCSTGVSPFTPTTVTSGKSQEVQVTCNAGDVALGGGVEVVNPPLPLDAQTITSTPENSFLLSNTTPIGWQVVLQNTSINSQCYYTKTPPVKLCPSVDFRVCVSCLQQPATP